MTTDLHVLMGKMDRAMGIAAEPIDKRGHPPGREWSLRRAPLIESTGRCEWRWYVECRHTNTRGADTPEAALQNALNLILDEARAHERANEECAKAARDRLADLRRAIES
jgi:hypothetical protein